MSKIEQASLYVLAWLIAALFVLGVAVVARGQSNTCVNGDMILVNTGGTKNFQCLAPNSQPAGTGTTMQITNAGVTGTTVNRLAKLTGAPSTAVITSTSDTDNAVGIVTAGAGTTGTATITILGQASCVFDGATTAGNYFTISATSAGACHDAGSTYPTSGATYGRVLSTNGGGGTYTVELMTPDVAFQNAGNGKSKPGTPNLSYQYNNSNVFTGGRLTQESTNVASVDGGVTTPQTLKIYGNNNGGTTAYLQLVGNTTQHTITSAGTDIKNLRLGVNTSYWEWGTSGVSFSADRAYNLGTSDSMRLNTVRTYDNYIYNNLNFAGNGSPRLFRQTDSQLHLIDGNGGSTAAIRFSFGDPAGNGPAINRPASAKYLVSVTANDTTTRTFYVDAGRQFTSAQFDKTNTTLANVTGLVSESLVAGRTYAFVAELFIDADVTGGSKYAIAGTATATAIKYHVDMTCDATNLLVITSRQTALAGSVGQAGCTAGLTRISGTITVNTAGTLAVQFAQNAANGTSSVLTMSKLEVSQLDN